MDGLRTHVDHHAAELSRLRADAARLEADREERQERSLVGGHSVSADDTSTDPGRDPRRLQARTIAQIAQAFRSSLTNVVGYSKLLLRGADGELSQGQKANVAIILEAGARLAALINGLSEYVRVEAGAEETTPTTIDVGPLLDEIATDSARDGRLQIVAVSAHDPLLVKADRRHLEHVLRALVTEAMSLDSKATGLLRTTPRDGAVVFELVLAEFHTAPEALRNLWDPFGSDDLSRPLDECHLRLAIARCLAEANGGQLRLEIRGPAEVAFVLEMQAANASLAA
jgi:K+-sensing histidine kinase KdpD